MIGAVYGGQEVCRLLGGTTAQEAVGELAIDSAIILKMKRVSTPASKMPASAACSSRLPRWRKVALAGWRNDSDLGT